MPPLAAYTVHRLCQWYHGESYKRLWAGIADGMVDTNVRGYDQGVVSDAKVPSLPSWEELSWLGILGGTILTVGSLLACLAAALNRLPQTFVFLILTMFPMRYCSQVGMEIFAPYISTKSLAVTIASTLQPGEAIVKDGRYEDIGAVSFYTGQKIYLVHGISQDLAFGSRYPEAAGTFLEEAEFLQLWNSEKRVSDFSVVLFRPNCMLASEARPMKAHKNQCLLNLFPP